MEFDNHDCCVKDEGVGKAVIYVLMKKIVTKMAQMGKVDMDSESWISVPAFTHLT